MARIVITTDQGEVVEVIEGAEEYNLGLPVTRVDLMRRIEDALRIAGADRCLGFGPEHRFDADLDRCACGGEWVYFENDDGPSGHGCEGVGEPVWPPLDAHGRPARRGTSGVCAVCGFGFDHTDDAGDLPCACEREAH